MGGDFGPHCIVPACLECLSEMPSLHLVLVGQVSVLKPLLEPAKQKVDFARISVIEASEAIRMDERPTQALRGKPRSSMHIALEMVRAGQAQACVSAGNTGALMAVARHVLKTVPGIDRPAIAASIPTEQGFCLLLDLGANVDCSAEHLYQFALMGSVAAQVSGIANPRVALLNVGTETIKGSQQVKRAAQLLSQGQRLNYQGFIEGDGLFRGEADVVVCDGFAGNVVLKSSEGLAQMISHKVEHLFKRSLWSRFVGLLSLPLLIELKAELMPSRYNGASFLGLQGVVVKSHGSAGPEGIKAAIRQAVRDVQQDVPGQLRMRLEPLLSQSAF
ncbi:phosphate:acyl-[acyl carrier protein] acyltransferase [Azomonas agilis]|uniref:Phosphate acyltransferase n=2 Tax=Azomonas agilis TaxID=116849 RepID=A0A562IZR1_9GAMM|nr:phosphate:acyl-[acyl carrier protein] acyltransferase [Azomonas agilis]